MSKILSLIAELKRAASAEGFHRALYDHADPVTFHTVRERQEMLNHQRIAEQVMKEIRHELEPKEAKL